MKMRDDLFVYYCVALCFADFINNRNRGEKFTWEKWLGKIVPNYVEEQCKLNNVEYRKGIVDNFSWELIRRAGVL